MKITKLFGLVFVPVALSATEISFTGADATNPTDLNVAANWSGGVVPGAEDVAVIDVATLAAGTTELTVSADWTVGGLRVDNNDRVLTIAPAASAAPVLTFGASGFVNTVTAVNKANFDLGIAFRVPLAVSCEQTWDAGRQNFITYSTVSGTDLLTIAKGAFIIHHEALGYGGKIKYSGPTASPNWERTSCVRVYSGGRWATELENANNCYLVLTNETSWSTLFANRYVKQTAGNFGLNVRYSTDGNPNGLIGRLVFEDGDTFECTGGTSSGSSQGLIDMKGGRWISNGEINVGYFSYYFGTWYPYNYKSIWTIDGGTLQATTAFTGHYCENTSTNNYYRFEQRGGDVYLTTALVVGGGNQGNLNGWGEYVMRGGSLNIATNSAYQSGNYGLKLMRCNAGQTSSRQKGVYTQTGGEVTTPRVSVGSDTSSSTKVYEDHYTLFDLKGGVFNLGAQGFSVSPYWNVASTNGAYTLRFSGGKLHAAADFTSVCPWTIAPGEGFTLDTDTHAVSLFAPVWGSGSLTKEGVGRVVLTDATRFTGSLDIREGAVEVLGAPVAGESEEAADGWIWTADSLAATLADGDSVTSWPDDVHGVVVTTHPRNSGVNNKGASYNVGNPVFKPDTFNGHASLKFSKACLAVPVDVNPLKDTGTNTIVVVYSPTTTSTGGSLSLVYGPVIAGGANGSYGHRYSVLTYGGADRIAYGRCYGGSTTASAQSAWIGTGDRKAHVVIGLTEGKRIILYSDGLCTTGMLDKAEQLLFPAQPFNIGGAYSDEQNFVSFNGSISEVRLYDRLLSDAACAQLSRELLVKYNGTETVLKKADSGHLAAAPGTVAVLSPTEPAVVATSWSADTLTAADGAEITSWANESGTLTATKDEAGTTALSGPTLVRNAMNGHSVLRFSRETKTALALPAADSPYNNATDFTVAVVFSTTSPGVGGNDWAAAKDTCNLIGGDLTTGKGNFGISLREEGTLMGQWGWSWGLLRKPFRLNDGLPHVAVLTRDCATKTVTWMVDGIPTQWTNTDLGALRRSPVMIGAQAKGSDLGFYEGDIAAFRLYDRAMTPAEMRELSDWYGAKYGFGLAGQKAVNYAELTSRGLGARTITVAAGSTLRLPVSETAPYTLKEGQKLTVKGTVEGTLRLGRGAMLAVDFNDHSAARIDALSVPSGTIEVELVNAPGSLKSWQPLVAVGTATVGADVVWDVVGYGRASTCEIRDGMLGIRSTNGSMMIFR